jgi:hypothetical protein
MHLLEDFARYCRQNPEQRFWQALRNWSGAVKIVVLGDDGSRHDTFYWQTRDGREST